MNRAANFLAAVSTCALLPSTLWAQGLEFSGNVSAGASHSDNIFLRTAPDSTDETVFQVSPSLSLDYENQRFNATVRYQYDWYRYSDLRESSEYHRYDAQLTGEVIDDVFFVEVGSSRSQSIADINSVIPSGGLPISSNLADLDEYYVNPRVETSIGRSITIQADYRYSDLSYDNQDFVGAATVQDNTNETANFNIEDLNEGQGLTWSAGYEWQESEYDLSLPWEYNRASGELGFWAGEKVRVFASGGQESAWDDPVDRSLQDDFWEAGFAYRNQERLSMEFAAGERSFGSSWRGNIDFSFRRGSLAFNYYENPTTNGFNRFSRGNLFDPDEPNDFLARPGSAERYISERGQARLNLEFRRTTVGFVAYDETRTGRFLADGTALPDENQSGFSANISWRAGVRTTLSASASINSQEFQTDVEQDFATASLSANYLFGSSIGLTATYTYSDQQPAAEGSFGRDYVANVVSLLATYSF